MCGFGNTFEPNVDGDALLPRAPPSRLTLPPSVTGLLFLQVPSLTGL